MNNTLHHGKIIIINGPSSSGKTTLALAVQKQFTIPFIRFSFDLFLDNQVLPMDQIRNGAFSWEAMRPALFTGLHQSLSVLAKAGNNLVFDHIIESKDMLADLLQSISGLDVFFVGLHCSLSELERREFQRSNRRGGEARTDFEVVHNITSYDLELNSEIDLDSNATLLIEAWTNRQRPSAFDRMIQEINKETR